MCRTVFACVSCWVQKNRMCSRTMARCLEFHPSTKATHKIKRTLYDYRNGLFDRLRWALEALNLCNLVQDSDDINLDWTYWKDAFMSALSDFIPTKKFKEKKRPPSFAEKWGCSLKAEEISYRPYNRSIENCVQRPRLVYVRAVRFTSAHLTQISRGSLNAFSPFLKLKNKTWTFPETKSSGDDNQQGPQASTPQQIAELFYSYFVSVFTAPSEIGTLSAHFTSSQPTLNELEIPVEMVVTSLKQLDINKATGSDGIPVRLLKESADQIAPSLTMLLNKSLRLGIFPGDWKLANIIPIFEKGKRDFVESYCPVSLLPVTSKVLKSHLIIREQHGFLAGRSCVTQVTSARLCLKTFVAPFLQARLTVPRSPRMCITLHWRSTWRR